MTEIDTPPAIQRHAISIAIPLAHMPQQLHAWTADDDWTGIIDRKERRKLQNRLNQRKYRLRRKDDSRESSTSNTPSTQNWNWNNNSQKAEEEDSEYNCSLHPLGAMKYRTWLEATARQSYALNSPRSEHLLSLTRLNVHRAINENLRALGMTPAWTRSVAAISIFNIHLLQPGPGFPITVPQENSIPLSLRPTAIQRSIPHHPWLDFFPFPAMRDRLILAGESLDDEELCHDLMAFWDSRSSGATLLVWGQSWDPRNWEVTEEFVRKWAWVLSGSPELIVSTNYWRRRRGERPLFWGVDSA